MEQKKTQRVIGIIVVIALVIIIYPLLFNNTQTATQQAESTITQSLPLPEQKPLVTTAAIEQPAPVVPSQENKAEPKPIPDDTKQTPAIANEINQMEGKNAMVKPFSPIDNSSVKIVNTSNITNPQKPHSLPPRKMVSASANKVKSPTAQDLLKLKRVAWAIQMGSFKNKENATRLTDKLRAAGYKAFTRQIDAKLGTQTRVYVGPEFKQIAAIKLSSKIEHDMKMHGIVIAYQPLTL